MLWLPMFLFVSHCTIMYSYGDILKEEMPCRKTRDVVFVNAALYMFVDTVKLELYLITLKVAVSPTESAGDAEKAAECTITGRSKGI